MALKFLNKKGWHTGSLRNIENVWKAEQKHEAEEKKLEELKKQIQDEREQHEFRLLQEQAGLVPRQERLEFLYDSGLSVGKNSGESFPLGKPGDPTKNEQQPDANKLPPTPGALFQEEKPASANDTWRKIHSDPLLMIRQREQEALAKIKNNPVKMEIIKKSVQQETVEKDKKKSDKKKHHKDKKKKKHISNDTDSGDDSHREERKSKKGKYKHDSFSNRDEMDGDRKDNRTSKEFLLNRKSQSSYQGERQGSPSPVRQGPQAKRNESRSSLEKRHADSPSGLHKRHRRRSHSVEDRGRNKYSNDGYKERSRSPNNIDQSRSYNNGHRHRSRSPNNRDRNRSSNHEHRRRSRSPDNQDRNRASNNEQRHRSRSPDNRDWNMSSNNRNRHRLRSPDNQDRNRSSNNWHRQRSGSPGNQDRSRSSNNWQRHRSPPKYEKTDKLSTSNGIFSVANGENVKASSDYSDKPNVNEPSNASNGRVTVARSTADNKSRTGKLSEEEKAARLREMQRDAEIHEEQRWRRLKKAADADEKEALESAKPVSKNFLDVTTKSIYGAEKGGSSTIEESIRRRTHYSQGFALDGNAFRR